MLSLRLSRLAADHRRRQPLIVLGTLLGIGGIAFLVTWAAVVGVLTFPLLVVGLITCLAQLALYVLVPWSRVPSVVILSVPTVWLVGLGACGAVIGPSATNFSGLTVLAFLFAGLTQKRGRSLWLLLVAVPVWFVMAADAGGANDLVMRLPVVLIVWIASAELTAFQTTGMRREMRRLDRKVGTDPLTRLANRRILPTLMRSIGTGDVLVLIDIDHFKSINDVHGHATGDLVLEDFGRFLLRCLTIDDTAVRFGGEELLVVLAHPTPIRLRAFDEQLRREIQAIEPAVSFTAGVARVADGESAEAALARADVSLYEMKASGRDRTGGDVDPQDVPTR